MIPWDLNYILSNKFVNNYLHAVFYFGYRLARSVFDLWGWPLRAHFELFESFEDFIVDSGREPFEIPPGSPWRRP